MSKTALNTLEGVVVSAEVSPLNEAIRYGALTASMIAGNNPVVSAAIMGVTTLLVEAPAGLAAADLLQNEKVNSAINKVNEKLYKLGVPEDAKLNLLTRAGVAWLGGTALSVTLKHREDTSRDFETNRNYALRAAASLAGVSAIQGFLIAEGIDHPDFKSIAGALISVGSILGLGGILKNKLGKHFKKQRIQESTDYYQNYLDASTSGPQYEGIGEQEAIESLEDPKTITLCVEEEGRKLNIPAIVPIQYSEWYNPDFYEKYSENGEGDDVYYFAVPPTKITPEQFKGLVEEFKSKNGKGTIFYDYHDIDEIDPFDALVSEDTLEGISISSAKIDDENELNASLALLAAPVEILDKKPVLYSSNDKFMAALQKIADNHPEYRDKAAKIRILDKPVSDKDFEELWSFYPTVFKEHNSDHPLMQSFDESSFREMLNSDETLWAVVTNDKSEIISATFIAQLAECKWLKQEYYKEKYPKQFEDEAIIHIPTIITHPDYRREGSIVEALELIADVVREQGTDFVVLGESTDATREVVPIIADAFFNDPRTGMKTSGMVPIAMYRYKALKVA